MVTGVQFTGSLPAGATQRWFTFNWPTSWHVLWEMMPTSPKPGAPEVGWEVAVELADATHCTYWLTVHNLSSAPMTFEGRYAIMNL